MEGENLRELVKKQAETIRLLEAKIVELMARIAELETTNAHLQKDSRNSSKPPSSDIVKPKTQAQKAAGGKKLKIGGQPGHKKHERTPFPPEQVDTTIEVTLDACPHCGGRLEDCEKEAVKNQQIDIAPKPFHRHGYWCPACQTYHTAPLGRAACFQ